MLLALPDCVSHIGGAAKINVALAHFAAGPALRVLLLQMEAPVILGGGLVKGQPRGTVLLGVLPTPSGKARSIRILHHMFALLVWRLLQVISLEV